MIARSRPEVGVRVRVHSPSPVLKLRGDTGRVIGRDPKWDGFYIVRLDHAAHYDDGVSEPAELYEIRVAGDNIETVADCK